IYANTNPLAKIGLTIDFLFSPILWAKAREQNRAGAIAETIARDYRERLSRGHNREGRITDDSP
ncbi:hypothetical protein, partial [Achromobacter sp.]|uniref:hypothetical protein n=1 Tax=Achromobacter sp. TaxID=134375 RepID=UPI0028970FD3